jgi:hypothetical protein
MIPAIEVGQLKKAAKHFIPCSVWPRLRRCESQWATGLKQKKRIPDPSLAGYAGVLASNVYGIYVYTKGA